MWESRCFANCSYTWVSYLISQTTDPVVISVSKSECESLNSEPWMLSSNYWSEWRNGFTNLLKGTLTDFTERLLIIHRMLKWSRVTFSIPTFLILINVPILCFNALYSHLEVKTLNKTTIELQPRCCVPSVKLQLWSIIYKLRVRESFITCWTENHHLTVLTDNWWEKHYTWNMMSQWSWPLTFCIWNHFILLFVSLVNSSLN